MYHNLESITDEAVSNGTSEVDLEENVARPHASKKSSFVRRLFNRDIRRFHKYIQSTTTHGVVHIFFGKSRIRRLMWLVIFLSAIVGCLYNVIDRTKFLANGPTATSVSLLERDSLDFPAVTLCNLNLVKKSILDSPSVLGDPEELLEVLTLYAETSEQKCRNYSDRGATTHEKLTSLSDLLWNGRHTAHETIARCRFMEQTCDANDFTPSLTPKGGVCYTFNSGKGGQIRKSNGTGTRFSLTLVVNVEQSNYTASFNQDAGIKIAIHPQTEPPQPDELGIAVPPGRNAFISMRQTNIDNLSRQKKCMDSNKKTAFNFTQSKTYSASACTIDRLMTGIAQRCNCLGAIMKSEFSLTPKFQNLRDCTISMEDICCQVAEISRASTSNCSEACNRTWYSTVTSYSAFPANNPLAIKQLNESIQGQLRDTDNISFQDNFLRVNIYFESLTIEKEITNNSYDAVGLLSDIGGQLALFLGASVISVLEFVMWIVDELKDRCCGIGERKLKHKLEARKKAAATGSGRGETNATEREQLTETEESDIVCSTQV